MTIKVYELIVLAICLLVIFMLGALIGRTSQPTPEASIYEKFNHFTLYEDGAFIGQNHDGVEVAGCVKGGLCND